MNNLGSVWGFHEVYVEFLCLTAEGSQTLPWYRGEFTLGCTIVKLSTLSRIRSGSKITIELITHGALRPPRRDVYSEPCNRDTISDVHKCVENDIQDLNATR